MASDDFFDGALDDFEAITTTATTDGKASLSSDQSVQPSELRSNTSSSPLPAAAPQTKAPAFDPLRKSTKKQRAPPPSAASTSIPFSEQASIPSTSQTGSLPPELQQLADDLAKLISESSLDDALQPGTSTSPASSAAAAPSPGARPAAATMASLQALEELTQRSVAAQGTLPGGGSGAQGQGLFGGMLPNLDGLSSDPSMNSIVDSIMQHLLSKDVLYQPMKDIRDCYPPWLEKSKGVVPAEDMERYERQYGYIQQICTLYEQEPSNYSQLVALMQQMQACGDPPDEIVKEMSAGLDHAPPEGGGSEAADAGDMPALNDLDLQQLQNEINKCPMQ